MKKVVALLIVISVLFGSVHINVLAAGSGSESQYEKGMEYFKNNDFDRAFSYFQISGEVKNYAPAQNMLGVCYRDGLGIKQDLAEAEKYFRLAADQGNAEAKENLAAMEGGKDEAYQNAMNLFFAGKYEEAKAIFESLGNYEHSKDFLAKCEEALAAPNKNKPVITSLTLDEKNRPVIVWNSVPNAASYRVYSSADNNYYQLVKSDVKTSLTSNSYYVSGKTYYFKVLAVYANGTESDYSDAISITIPAKASPTQSFASNKDKPVITSLTLDEKNRPVIVWDPVPNAASYRVYSSTDKNYYHLVKSDVKTSLTSNAYYISGKTYYFKVLAVYADGTESYYSDVKSIVIPAASSTLASSGYVGAVRGKWNGRINLNDSNTGIYELVEPIKKCKSLTMQVKFYNIEGHPEGTYYLYGRSEHGHWNQLGEFELTSDMNNTVITKTYKFDENKQVSITAVAIAMHERNRAYTDEWSVSNSIEIKDVYVYN